MFKPRNTIKLVNEKSIADFVDVVLEDSEYSEQYIRIQNADIMEAYKEKELTKTFKVEYFVFYGDEDEYRDEFFDKYVRNVDSFSVKGSADLAKLISALTRFQDNYEMVISRGFTDYKDRDNIVKYFEVYVFDKKAN